jgi:hypothetical protein
MTMTFNTALLGVFVFIFSQSLFAGTQTISCENNVRVVLFGTAATYGEEFSTGLLTTPLTSSPATLAAKHVGNSNVALLSGSDFTGNSFRVKLPEVVLGKVVQRSFPILAAVKLTGSKRERAFTVNCISSLTE